MKPRADGQIAKCECGHPQPSHPDVIADGRTHEGAGACDEARCRCKRFVWTGWVPR